MERRNGTHILAVAVACILWGGSIIGTKLSYDSFAPFSLGLVRFAISTAIFFVLLVLRHETEVPQGRELLDLALSGFLGTTIYFAAENYGASLASGATSSLVIGSFPAMTMALECAIDRKAPQPRMALGIALAFLGLSVLAFTEGGTGSNELVGILVLMVGGMSWAIYNVMMRSIAGSHSPLAITAWQTLFGTLGFIPFALWEGEPFTGLSPTAIASLAYLVLGCTVAGFSLYNYGFERLSPTVASSLVNLTPVVGIALSALVLGESISRQQVIGGIVVVGGIILSTLPERGAQPLPEGMTPRD